MAEGSHPSKPLEKYKKQESVAFLKARGVPSSGNKEHLLRLAKLYANFALVVGSEFTVLTLEIFPLTMHDFHVNLHFPSCVGLIFTILTFENLPISV